jgi:hypothetical protein
VVTIFTGIGVVESAEAIAPGNAFVRAFVRDCVRAGTRAVETSSGFARFSATFAADSTMVFGAAGSRIPHAIAA